MPNGTVHSVCTDPTQATARLVIVLVRRIQKSGTRENNFGKMERDSSVGPTEMTGPVKVDHLQRCSQIFQSDRTELVRSICNRNFRNFGLNGKRPYISLAAWIQPVNCCCNCKRRWFFKTLKGGYFLVLFALTFSFNFSHSPAMMITRTCDSSAMHAGSGSARLG